MRLNKAILSLLVFTLIANLTYGQGREDVFYASHIDPIKSIQIYPNPATEFLNVKLEAPHARQVKLTCLSILGSAIELETEVVDEFEIRIRVKDLTSGYYFISVQDEKLKSKSTYKFLKR
ncbi:MAG: T9SS type A sorting domain-containing protein [Cyclobacteriaceae bacterium]|nr:T9SS type A sorting domain-containing protein [Cyclobacteriaceae bacterium]